MPVQTNLLREFNNTLSTPLSVAKVGETWFFPEQKLVLISVCELSGSFLTPLLFELDTVKETLTKVFPV